MNNEDLYETEMSFEDLEAISGGLVDRDMKYIRQHIYNTKLKLAKGRFPQLEGMSKEQILDRYPYRRWTPEQRAYAEQVWDEIDIVPGGRFC